MIKTRGMTQEEIERLLPHLKPVIDEYDRSRLAAQEAKNPMCNRSTYALDRNLVNATLALRNAERVHGVQYVKAPYVLRKVTN